MIITEVLDYLTRTMDDMAYWFMGSGVVLTVAVIASGAVSW